MNTKNTAVKRINADVKEIAKHATWRYHAAPLEEDIFEWHFTIRGPTGSDFEGGVYHGRILLSSEYPFKPPNIIFLTKNGRFEVGTKICLSISAYHPEHWQPAWGVRTMLEAIVSFLPSEGHGAIGALDWTPLERAKLAEESHQYTCPHCGPIDSLIPTPLPPAGQHDQCKEEHTATDTPDQKSDQQEQRKGGEEEEDEDMAARIAQMHVHGLGASTPPSSPATPRRKPPLPSSSDSPTRTTTTANSSSSGSRSSGTVHPSEFDPARLAANMPDDPTALRAWLLAGNGVELIPGGRSDFFEQQRQQIKADAEEEERDKAGNRTDDMIFYALLVLFCAIVYLLMKRYEFYSSQNNQFAYRDL